MNESIDVKQVPQGVLLAVKAVPGASRDQIAGRLGRRLKIRVSAAAEDGRANDRILQLIAKSLGVSRSDCRIESGLHHAEKTILIRTDSIDAVMAAIEQLA